MLAVLAFSALSLFLFVQHELHSMNREAAGLDVGYKKLRRGVVAISHRARDYFNIPQLHNPHSVNESYTTGRKNDDTPEADEEHGRDDDVKEDDDDNIQEPGEEPRFNGRVGSGMTPVVAAKTTTTTSQPVLTTRPVEITTAAATPAATVAVLQSKPPELPIRQQAIATTVNINTPLPTTTAAVTRNRTTELINKEASIVPPVSVSTTGNVTQLSGTTTTTKKEVESKGKLVCEGKEIDSEVIYWKIVPGDVTYESPITPHHGKHHDRYLSFEYDQGGWNNVRMSLECLIVVAHAMGRTLVVPPQQHLYLLGVTHKDKEDTKAHDEMGFEDFFDIDLLRSHRGYHVLHMEEFLEKEAGTGGLHGELPPGNTSKAWGDKLWRYLKKVADEKPTWGGHFVVFPDHPGNFSKLELLSADAKRRLEAFTGGRQPVFYDDKLQQAHHVHFPADGEHRILQHHYGMFTFKFYTLLLILKRENNHTH